MGGNGRFHGRYYRSQSFNQPPRNRGRRFDRNLLTQNSANGNLEPIPAARQAQARIIGDDGRKKRILAQMVTDLDGVGLQVKQATGALGDELQMACQMGRHAEAQLVFIGDGLHVDNAA